MIKLLIKHLIYEQCINVLFDKIRYNFLFPEIIEKEYFSEYQLPKIKAQYPMILSNMYSDHVVSVLTEEIRREIRREIDREIINELFLKKKQ